MTDYTDDYDDNAPWDGQTDGYVDLDDDYPDDEDFDCGWDGESVCLDIGSEHCSFWCPFHRAMMDTDSDSFPLPVDTPQTTTSDDMDDIPW